MCRSRQVRSWSHGTCVASIDLKAKNPFAIPSKEIKKSYCKAFCDILRYMALQYPIIQRNCVVCCFLNLFKFSQYNYSFFSFKEKQRACFILKLKEQEHDIWALSWILDSSNINEVIRSVVKFLFFLSIKTQVQFFLNQMSP